MKSVLSVAALAGVAGLASAQVGSVTVNASATSVNVGDVVTISVVVDDDGSTAGVFGFDVAVTGGGAAYSTVAGSLAFNGAVFGAAGVLNAGGADALGGSSDILGPTLDAPLNGLAVYSFQITADGLGVISLSASDGSGPNPALQYGIEGGIVILPGNYADIVFNGVSINVVPAPSGMALLGLGGLVAARRRR